MLRNLAKALRGFPKYIYEATGGLLVVLLTDAPLTLLGVFAILLGALTTPLTALVVFFGIYSVLNYVTQIIRQVLKTQAEIANAAMTTDVNIAQAERVRSALDQAALRDTLRP